MYGLFVCRGECVVNIMFLIICRQFDFYVVTAVPLWEHRTGWTSPKPYICARTIRVKFICLKKSNQQMNDWLTANSKRSEQKEKEKKKSVIKRYRHFQFRCWNKETAIKATTLIEEKKIKKQRNKTNEENQLKFLLKSIQ